MSTTIFINVPEPVPQILHDCRYIVNPTTLNKHDDNNHHNKTVVVVNTNFLLLSSISKNYIDNGDYIYKYDSMNKSLEDVILDINHMNNYNNLYKIKQNNVPSVDQFQGCMVGIAVGDTIGLPVEGLPREGTYKYMEDIQKDLTKYTPPWHRVNDFINAKRKAKGREPITMDPERSYKLGQVSDDTQCSLSLAESMIYSNGFSVQSFSDTMTALHISPGIVGQGPTSRACLDKLAEKEFSWLDACFNVGEKKNVMARGTNGSIMRVGPLGLWGWMDPKASVNLENAILSSHVTHPHPDSKIGAAMLTIAVASAVNGKANHITDISEFICSNIEHLYPNIGQTLRAMKNASGWEEALNILHDRYPCPDNHKNMRRPDGKEISMYPYHTAGWAIYSFLSNPNNFWESMFTCLKPGGDTDTVAACCGSIAGAYNGLQKIIDERHDSMHVLKHIHDETQEGKIGLEELKEVGNKLYVVCVGASSKL